MKIKAPALNNNLNKTQLKNGSPLGSKDVFKALLAEQGATKELKNGLLIQKAKLEFSAHAIDRMKFRGVNFSKPMIEKIEQAIGEVKAKGGKETLVITDTAALIVDVEKNKVVTVLDKALMKDNIVTKIDSTIMI